MKENWNSPFDSELDSKSKRTLSIIGANVMNVVRSNRLGRDEQFVNGGAELGNKDAVNSGDYSDSDGVKRIETSGDDYSSNSSKNTSYGNEELGVGQDNGEDKANVNDGRISDGRVV